MPELADKDILDLAQTTLDQLDRDRWTMLATRLQKYECIDRILRKDKRVYGSGAAIRKNVMLRHNGAASQTQMFATDNVNIVDVMDNIEVPWRHSKTSWAFDRREQLMNSGESEIVSLIKSRRVQGFVALVELLEEQLWGVPTGPSDKLNVWGIPHWLQKNATEGFNGGNPAGFSDMAGISASTETRWRNYTAPYVNVSKTDLIKKMRTAYDLIRFLAPTGVDDYNAGRNGDMYRIYTNYDVYSAFNELGEAQNENLGRDLASMDGTMMFRKNPIAWIPALADDASDPVYMINWNEAEAAVLRGDDLHETPVDWADHQHNTAQSFIDLTWNIVFSNRRSHAVLSK